MNEANETFHSLIVAPKTLVGIRAQYVGESDNTKKDESGTCNPRKFWHVRAISDEKKNPNGKNNLYSDSKNKAFTCNKREELEVSYYEGNKKNSENTKKYSA